jgi:hypothetical protein
VENDMTDFNARQVRWMSGVAALIAAVMVSLFAGQGPPPVELVIITVVLVLAAIALWTLVRPARWLVAAGVAFVSAYAVYGLVDVLPGAQPQSWQEWLVVGDAIASTSLAVWLGVRAVWILIDRARAPSRVTPRIVGGFLVVVAATHLSWIALWEPGADIGTQLSLSPGGVFLFGFTGWPVWHGVLAAIGLGLALAPARWVAHFATLLIVLVLYAVPASLGGPLVIWQLPAMLALPLYMAVWLRVELGRATRA